MRSFIGLLLLCVFAIFAAATPHGELGKVRYFLYTRGNPIDPQELFLGDLEGIRNSNFVNSRHTKILVHGWVSNYKSTPNPELREAYLDRDEYNIISIDWTPYAKLNYVLALNKLPLAGEEIAQFLDFLYDEYSLDFDKVLIAGYSMGVHLCGFAGKFVKRGKVGAIVGLDPALPLYTYDKPETRLASTDAKYVISIQTNGNMLGFYRPIGVVSFYPNWGLMQPGCTNDPVSSCSHDRSVEYYAEALRCYSFAPIYKCSSFDAIQAKDPAACILDSRIRMGDPLEVEPYEGIYFFETNTKAPFGRLVERITNLCNHAI